MSLSGHVSELALGDLLQVTAMHRRTCCIEISDPLAAGEIYFESGELTHAHFGELLGNEAVYALLARDRARFEMRSGVRTKTRTVSSGFHELLLESARLRDEGYLIEPRTPGRRSSLAPLLDTMNELISSRWSRRTAVRVALVACALAAIGVVLGWLLGGRQARSAAGSVAALAPGAAPSDATAEVTAISSAELTGPGDEGPVLIAGGVAQAPALNVPPVPTIVCRVLVSAEGMVQQVQVHRSRAELAAFEAVAVEAAKRFRFRPARRAGEVTPAWVTVPVPFRSHNAADPRFVRVKGSDTIGGALGPALAQAYGERHGEQRVEVEALGSATAFIGLLDGTAEIGASSRPVSAAELERARELGLSLQEFAIGYDGIAVIVHPDNPLRLLSLDDAGAVFRGEITEWSQLPTGGDGPIRVLSRPSYSGTHEFFRERVLTLGVDAERAEFGSQAEYREKTEDLVIAVQKDPLAIAYVGLGWADERVQVVPVSVGANAPVLPTQATVRDGTYPIYRPLLMYTRGRPQGETASFLRFVLSPAGQTLVQQHGFVGSNVPVNIPQDRSLRRGLPPEAGPEVVRVFFHSGEAELDRPARAALTSVVEVLREGNHHVILSGAADANGDPHDNAFLADQRAHRVASYLNGKGIEPEFIRIESGGQSRAIASNGSEEGRRANRRVDLYLVENR